MRIRSERIIMQKVIRKLIPENNMDFEDICSFETESYIGIWNHKIDDYVVFAKSDCEFWLHPLPTCIDLEELDNKIYDLVQEHIIGVSECSSYIFEINEG